MSEQVYVAAYEVEPGSYIPGLDNAYVFQVDHAPDVRDENNMMLSEGCVGVWYNDREGGEGLLLLTRDTRIEVLRQ